MPARFTKRIVSGSIGCLLVFSAGCELENAVVPRIIPGPSVPSPAPLRAPYIWDTREELVVWTGNSVSRGSFSIDTDDSNGAIAIQVPGSAGTLLVLRGPDIEPPAQAILAVRIRYRWFPDAVRTRCRCGWRSTPRIHRRRTSSLARSRRSLPRAGWQES